MRSFEQRLAEADLTLFSPVGTLTTADDRRSLLALQACVREAGPYGYLEIGSHRGGSLQPFLADDRCVVVHSVERREPAPQRRSDPAKGSPLYAGVTTGGMLAELREAHGPLVDKVVCHDRAAGPVVAADLRPRPRLCLIDGDHTDEAAREDFALCLEAIGGDGVVAFHDANLVYLAIDGIVRELESQGAEFEACFLPSTLLVLSFGSLRPLGCAAVRELVSANYRGYIYSLVCNDGHRRFAQRPVFRLLRALRSRLTWRRGPGPVS